MKEVTKNLYDPQNLTWYRNKVAYLIGRVVGQRVCRRCNEKVGAGHRLCGGCSERLYFYPNQGGASS